MRDLAPRPGDPLEAWPAFVASVRARLELGRSTYGDESFGRDPAALLSEVAEELLDVAGWSFILWARVQVLAAKLVGRLEEVDE